MVKKQREYLRPKIQNILDTFDWGAAFSICSLKKYSNSGYASKSDMKRRVRSMLNKLITTDATFVSHGCFRAELKYKRITFSFYPRGF